MCLATLRNNPELLIHSISPSYALLLFLGRLPTLIYFQVVYSLGVASFAAVYTGQRSNLGLRIIIVNRA